MGPDLTYQAQKKQYTWLLLRRKVLSRTVIKVIHRVAVQWPCHPSAALCHIPIHTVAQVKLDNKAFNTHY